MRLSILPVILLALPLLEIATFVLVGREIGVLPTIGLTVATGIVGAMLLRFQGFGVLTRIRGEVLAKRDPSRELAHGIMILLAGLLLLIPGFLTDMVGILLFLPPIRDLAWKFLRRRIDVVGRFSTGGFGTRQPGGRGKTIDLDSDDYSEDGPDASPWRRIDRD